MADTVSFDKSNAMYRLGNVQIPREVVAQQIDKIGVYVGKQAKAVSSLLWKGEINLPEWQLRMRDLIRTGHVLAGAIGNGGFEQMTAARWGEVGAVLKKQYGYLNNFARQIEQGKVIFESQLGNRAQLYANSVRVTYYQGEKRIAREAGFEEAVRVLHASESCSECLDAARQGYRPIDDQPEIGSLICGHFCRCTLRYK